jgi:hypothetical protein
MPRWFALVVCTGLALGACSGKAAYQPPVDPMLPGDGYHARAMPDCAPSLTMAQCAAVRARQAFP